MDWQQPSWALAQAEHQISYGGCATTAYPPLHAESPLGSRLPCGVASQQGSGARDWGQ